MAIDQSAIDEMLNFAHDAAMDENLPKISRLTAEMSKEIYEPFIRWMDSKRVDESASPGEVMVATIRMQSAMTISILMVATDWNLEKDLATIEHMTTVYNQYLKAVYNDQRRKYHEAQGMT